MKNENSSVNLNNIAPTEELLLKESELQDIPLEKIRLSDFCQRGDIDEDIDELAESIEKNGLLQYPTVTDNDDGFFTLIFGSRRYLAHKRLGRSILRCHVRKVKSMDAAFLSIIENSVRRNRHPVEEAKVLQRLKIELNLTDSAIAAGVGWPQSVVAERLAILRLPKDVLEKIDTRQETPFKFSHALALSKLWDSGRHNCQTEVRELMKKTISHKLSTTELKRLLELFIDAKFDCLPDTLRTYLFTSKSMTADLAELYLSPQIAITGEDEKAIRQRTIAENLDKKLIENLIAVAVKHQWNYQTTQKKVQELINKQTQAVADEKKPEKSVAESMIDDISTLVKKLSHAIIKVSELTQSEPGRLNNFCNALIQLQVRLDPLIRVLKDSAKESKIETYK